MGIQLDDAVPSERTLRDFERFLLRPHPESGVPRYLLFHEHVVRLCLDSGLVGPNAVWAGDSTPMWCYGATLDTTRLLGDGLRMLARRWAKATRQTLADVAATWELPWLTAKSTKGGLNVDWRSPDERAAAIDQLASAVVTVTDRIQSEFCQARRGLRKPVLRLVRQLLRVVSDDLVTDEQGRLVVAKHVAKDRIVSLTDPEARSGRKSKSQTFQGFKLHLVGDVVSGLIAAVTVTAGNVHDSRPAHRLIRRAKSLSADIQQVLADTAYGAVGLRQRVQRTLGVRLVAPPPKGRVSKDKTRVAKSDFLIDFETNTAMCPNAVLTDELKTSHAKGELRRYFYWPKESCGRCPLRERCLGKGGARKRIALHPQEQELRQYRDDWSKPEVQRSYRDRSQCERLINQAVRHGGRKARAWGLAAANQQAHAITAVCNLALLARHLADAA